MRYFDRHRKRLTKHHYIRGTLKSVSGEQEVKIEDSAGVPFNKIEIAGNTSQKQYQGYQQIGFKDFTQSCTDTDGNVLNIDCKDGIFTLNGKSNKRIPFTFDNKTMSNQKLKAGTYTFTTTWMRETGADGLIANSGGCDSRYIDSVTGEDKYLYFSERTVVTFENDITFRYMQPYMVVNREFDGDKFAIGVFKGDVATADFPPYETYVGGIPSPNPLYPQEIENTNSEGMSVVVRNPNLLQFKDYSGGKTDSDGNVLTWEMKDGIVTVNGKTNAFTVINLDGKSFVQEVYEPGTYSYTASYYNSENPLIRGCDWLFRYTDDNTSRIGGYTEGSTPSRRVTTKTIDKPFRLGCAQLYIYANTEYKDFKYTIGLFKGSYTAETMPPYSTYFREEIAIPTSVEVEGEIVDLRFAKQGEKADKLIVDKISGKVTYEQWVKTEPLPIESATWNVTTTANQVNTLRVSTLLYNSYSGIRMNEGLLINKFKEIFDLTLDEQSFYLATGSLLGWIGIRVNRDLLETQDSAGVKKWLQTQQDEGDPVLVNYALLTPITHDITSTELGQALLGLCVDRGLDGTLRVESGLGISSLSCDYYSQENEDKVLLTVSYQNEAGDALMNDKTHNVRRGSKYQIVSLQIDGYEPSEKEVFGIADGDLTIILKYKEVSDVTV